MGTIINPEKTVTVAGREVPQEIAVDFVETLARAFEYKDLIPDLKKNGEQKVDPETDEKMWVPNPESKEACISRNLNDWLKQQYINQKSKEQIESKESEARDGVAQIHKDLENLQIK